VAKIVLHFNTVIPFVMARLTALSTYGYFELPPFPEVVTLALELWFFSGMMPLPDRQFV
jgi:hypothetical protein